MYVMIAVIKNNSTDRYFRLYDCSSEEVNDIKESELLELLKESKLRVENIGLNEEDKIVGTQGNIERYALLGETTEARYKYPIVILDKTRYGYDVADCIGNSMEMKEQDLIQYAKQFGVANAKVVKKDKTEFISAISGTFEVVGGRLSDDLKAQWERIQSLKADGKLSEKSVKKIESLEPEFKSKMHKLKQSELRNKLNGAFDLARTYNIINKMSDVLDEIDIDRVEDIQKKVSKQYKEIKALGRAKKKEMDKEKRDKFNNAIKVIGRELKKTIRYVEEEEVSSDECIRRFEVIGKHLIKIKNSI